MRLYYRHRSGGWEAGKSIPNGTRILTRQAAIDGERCWHEVVSEDVKFSGLACLEPRAQAYPNVRWPLPPGWRRAVFRGTTNALVRRVDADWFYMVSEDGRLRGYAPAPDVRPTEDY